MKHIVMTSLIFLLLIFCCFLPAPAASASIVKIGNPGLEQFPRNNTRDCYARSVWDMQYYNGSIYVGVGDYITNRGPIDVWSFDANKRFRREYTVDEEQVYIFREYDGKLFIPGMDSTESWKYGNFYIKDGTIWQKLRTIPDALHVADVAVFEGNIYVMMSSEEYSAVMESPDGGQSWRGLPANGRVLPKQIIALDDFLIVLGTERRKDCVYRYSKDNQETLFIPLFPDGKGSPDRSVRFRDGILYTSSVSRLSLFFLSDFSNGAVIIERFRGVQIRDIVVRDDICFVMTASETGNGFQGAIFSSTNLDDWTELAAFTVPALPHSFELLDEAFYVGLGSRQLWEGHVDAESGSIYRVDLHNLPWDINKDGVVNISDVTLVTSRLGKSVTVPLEPDADVNDDGKIDIRDIILVAKHFGEVYH